MLIESEISDLINQSGRLRMLSHRSGMLLSFVGNSSTPDPWFIEELEKTSENFLGSYEKIAEKVSMDDRLSSSFDLLLSEQTEEYSSIESIVETYLSQLSKLRRHLQNTKQLDQKQLQFFLKLIAVDLLAALNKMVMFFESKLIQFSEEKAQGINGLASEVKDSLGEVDNINLTVKMLALNASVEAARAGDAGKSFGVISKEMNDLSQQIRQVSDSIKRDLKAFVEKI